MMILLRSVFQATPVDDPKLLYDNYLKLLDSGIIPDNPEDQVFWKHVVEFVHRNNHVPDKATLVMDFTQLKEPELVDRIENLSVNPMATKGNFVRRLEGVVNDRKTREVTSILSDAGNILKGGMIIKEGKKSHKLVGPIDAMQYVRDKAHSIVAPIFGSHLSGEITKDGVEFKREYDQVEADPLSGIGQFSGIEQMDLAFRGVRRKELWVHAGYTGAYKSIISANWAYNQSVYYGHSSLFFSLEMPYNQIRRIFYAIHSIHEKFRTVRLSMGLQKDPESDVGIDYARLRDGLLTPQEKAFMFNYVQPDFNGEVAKNFEPWRAPDGMSLDPPNGYGEVHIEVADPDKDDFTIVDMRAKAETLYSKNPYAMLIIDHMGLMACRTKALTSTTERLNEVIRDVKKFALGFNRGQGMAILGLMQISRQAYNAALKTKRYSLSALSYSNESERSADVVTSSFVDDDLRAKNRIKLQCLKSRDNAPFADCYARVENPCRRILSDTGDVEMVTGKKEEVAKEAEMLDRDPSLDDIIS